MPDRTLPTWQRLDEDDFPRGRSAPGLWVITVYYNPCGYRTRRENYEIFAETLRRSRIPLITLECAFGDEAYELPARYHAVRIRSDSLLWQKERLLNLAASWLPSEARYVAWIDCDVAFLNRNWALDTIELLKTKKVVQLFERCVRLERGNILTPEPDVAISFGAIAGKNPQVLSLNRYDAHGHTGYAWAMQREIFDAVGLYEAAISGSADHFMAHAIYGDCGFCVENALKRDSAQIEHFKRWSAVFYEMVQGKFAAVPGTIAHLWHGSLANRAYFSRMWQITDLGYNPDTDLLIEPGKPLEWAPHVRQEKPALVAYFDHYFASRREDEDASSTTGKESSMTQVRGVVPQKDIATIRDALNARLASAAAARRSVEDQIRSATNERARFIREGVAAVLPDLEKSTLVRLQARYPRFLTSDRRELMREAYRSAPFMVWAMGDGSAWRKANIRQIPFGTLKTQLAAYLGEPGVCLDSRVRDIDERLASLRARQHVFVTNEEDIKKRLRGFTRLSEIAARPGTGRLLNAQTVAAVTSTAARLREHDRLPRKDDSSSSGLSLFDVWLLSQLLHSGSGPTSAHRAEEAFVGRSGDSGGAGATGSFDDAPMDVRATAPAPSLGSALGMPDTVPAAAAEALRLGGDADHKALGSDQFS